MRAEHDRYPYAAFFEDVLNRAFDLGFFHAHLPWALGGMGPAITPVCTLLSSICEEDASLGAVILTNALAQEILIQAGEEDFVRGLSDRAGKAADFLVAFPLYTHPSEGPRMPYARERGGRYLVSGRLAYVSLGNAAANALIPAKLEADQSFSFFFINAGARGYHPGTPVLSHGLRACPAVDLDLRDAEGILIGSREQGSAYFQKAVEKMQIAAAAISCGILRGSWREAFSYSKARMQGGRRIRDWSELQMILSDMAISAHSSEMLLENACQAFDSRQADWERYAAAASLQIQRSAVRMTSEGVQVLGGAGYMKDFPQEKRFRDAGQSQSFMGLFSGKKLRFFRMAHPK
jgi:alkylation response protein AidB-like acyl-CoA dehydrogenase